MEIQPQDGRAGAMAPFTFCMSSANIGKLGLRHIGNAFIAKSPTKASPVSNTTLTAPGECPGVEMTFPANPNSAKENASSPKMISAVVAGT